MVAYFVRRLVGGLLTLLTATFVLHYIVLYSPGAMKEQYDEVRAFHNYKPADIYILARVDREYHFDIAWPRNYFVWLFNNSVDSHSIPDSPEPPKRDIDISVGNLHIQGSGILTGYFGASWSISKGNPALEQYMSNGRANFSALLIALLSLMLIATLQRRGRSPAIRSTHVPARSRWRPAELWPMG